MNVLLISNKMVGIMGSDFMRFNKIIVIIMFLIIVLIIQGSNKIMPHQTSKMVQQNKNIVLPVEVKEINIKKLGVKGDGTDESRKIQNIIASLPDGSKVIFPPGTYKCKNIVLNNKKNITLYGLGALLQMPIVGTYATDFTLKLIDCSNCKIYGLKMDGAKLQGVPGNGITGISGIVITAESHDIDIIHCKICNYNNAAVGVYKYSDRATEPYNIKVNFNNMINTDCGIIFYGANNCEAIENTIEGGTSEGISIFRDDDSSPSWYIERKSYTLTKSDSHHITVSRNVIKNKPGTALNVQNGYYCTLVGNKGYNVQNSIMCKGIGNIFDNNVFYTTNSPLFMIKSYKCKITNNKFYKNTNGLSLSNNCDDVDVSGNLIFYTTATNINGAGILVTEGLKNSRINGNLIESTEQEGIRLHDGIFDHILINNNRFIAIGTIPFFCGSSLQFSCVKENKIDNGMSNINIDMYLSNSTKSTFQNNILIDNKATTENGALIQIDTQDYSNIFIGKNHKIKK